MSNYLNLPDNAAIQWLLFGGIVLVSLALQRVLGRLVGKGVFLFFKRFAGTGQRHRFVSLLAGPLSWLITLSVAYVAIGMLRLPKAVSILGSHPFDADNLLRKAFGLLWLGMLMWAFTRAIDFVAGVLMVPPANREPGPTDHDHDGFDDTTGEQMAQATAEAQINHRAQFVPFFKDLARVLVVVVFILIALSSVFGLNVGALVGGLGIGGLAVALAAQETLANLLGSFTIFLDKPFVVGDLIESQGITGTVEKIGFRSTRIRTVNKSYVSIPNKNLVSNALNNITESSARRAEFNLTLAHGTTPEAVEEFVEAIRALLDGHPHVLPGSSVNFFAFTDTGLQLLIAYLVDSPAYEQYVATREHLNFGMLRLSNRTGVTFAANTTFVRAGAGTSGTSTGTSSAAATGSTALGGGM